MPVLDKSFHYITWGPCVCKASAYLHQLITPFFNAPGLLQPCHTLLTEIQVRIPVRTMQLSTDRGELRGKVDLLPL
jgi:hypothetical protein